MYEKKIPAFAFQPAKEAETEQALMDDGFDPTPYDRLLAKDPKEQENRQENVNKEEMQAISNREKEEKSILQEMERDRNGAGTDGKTDKGKKEEVGEENQGSRETTKDPLIPKEDTDHEKKMKKHRNTEAYETVCSDTEKKEERSQSLPVELQKMQPGIPVTIQPMTDAAVYRDLKLQTIVQQLETNVLIEEDILVPDVKPDLITILSMDGKPVLSGRDFHISKEEESLRVTGEVALQTIYLPEEKQNESMITIASRLPFKTDWQMNVSPNSNLAITPTIEKIEHTVVNERKIRARITLKLTLKEYAEKNLRLFENLKGEDLYLKREKMQLKHIALRKEETLEISETFSAKEGDAVPVKLLKYEIHPIENHKQITAEKIVINGTVLCSILYRLRTEKEGEVKETLEFQQNKIDFTQFILLENIEKPAAGRVSFDSRDLTIQLDETGDCPQFILSGVIHTAVELYEVVEREVISDFYHKVYDTTCDREEKKISGIVCSGNTEASSRELIHVSEQHGSIGKVLYLSGKVKESRSTMENGRSRTEGVLQCRLLCMTEEEEAKPFVITQEIPFRGTVELPEGRASMTAESRIFIRDLWFDRMNDRQIEVNASILIETGAIDEKTLTLVKNPCILETTGARPAPMVIYLTKKGDTLWNIAKKYKSSIENIAKINELSEVDLLKEGTRLLVVK